MNSINIIFKEMKDLKENITYLKEKQKYFDEEFHKLLNEIRVAQFNAVQGVELYKSTQEFLQERRVLKTKLESLYLQYEILGGDETYEKIKNNQTCQEKYIREYSYYTNFKNQHKKEIESLYHIQK